MSDNLKPPGSLMIEVCGAQMSVGDGWQLCGLEPGHSGPHGWEHEEDDDLPPELRKLGDAFVAVAKKYAHGVDQELLTAIALLSECRSTMPRTYGGEPNMTWMRVDAFLNRVGSDDNE